MVDKKNFLAIIPARSGSKRLPSKNILNLCGKPLISWTIEAAKKSQYIDEVLVTSDDNEILKIAEDHEVRAIKRPSYLASDTATSFDAIKHAINNTEEFKYIVFLQPTSPLRTSKHIDEAIKVFLNKNADAVISVTEMEHSPEWANKIPESGSMVGFLKEEVVNKRSQDLDVYYRLNGAVYIIKTKKFLEFGGFFIHSNIYSYEMDRFSSIDIDTLVDFKFAEFVLSNCLL